MPNRRTDPVRPLSAVDGLTQLAFLITATLERRAAEQDLSLIQTRLLGILRDREPSMQALARWLGLDKSSLTGLVDRAERRGLVVRTPSATDRRVTRVRLTAHGRALGGRIAAQFEVDMAQLLASLPLADRQSLAGLVSRVLVAHAAGQGVDLFAARGVDPAG